MSEKLSAEDPRNAETLSDVANSHLKLAEALVDQGDTTTALIHERKTTAILEGMLTSTHDVNLQRLLVRSRLAAGDTELKMKQCAAAIPYYQTAFNLAEQLVKNDPGQTFARTELARGQMGLAQCKAQQGEWRAARDNYQGAWENWTALRRGNALAFEDAVKPALAWRGLQAAAARIRPTATSK